jgi:hypothetical protein
VGCSLFGFYTTIGTLATNGMGAVLRSVASGSRASLVGAPEPMPLSYTGVAALDRQLTILVGFFSAIIDGDVAPEITLFYGWGLAQFAVAWSVLLLESRRHGNRGKPIIGGSAWLAVVGMLCQNLGYVFVGPLWLAAHLFISPVARLRPPSSGSDKTTSTPDRIALFAYLWDLALLPTSVTLSYIAPALLMSTPKLLDQAPTTHYGLVALWQVFPVVNVVLLSLLHAGCLSAFGSLALRDERDEPTGSPARAYLAAASGIYDFALTAAVGTQTAVVGLALLPVPLRATLASALPLAGQDAFFAFLRPLLDPRITLAGVFVPRSPFDPPTVNPTAYTSGELAPLALHFFQYDMYVGGGALLLWALYLHQTTVRNASLVGALKKVAFWFLMGGPNAAVVALLRDRDNVVLEYEEESKKTN